MMAFQWICNVSLILDLVFYATKANYTFFLCWNVIWGDLCGKARDVCNYTSPGNEFIESQDDWVRRYEVEEGNKQASDRATL
jgi:hypothetical protein